MRTAASVDKPPREDTRKPPPETCRARRPRYKERPNRLARPFRLDEEQVLHFAVRSVLLLDPAAAVNERVKVSETSASERRQRSCGPRRLIAPRWTPSFRCGSDARNCADACSCERAAVRVLAGGPAAWHTEQAVRRADRVVRLHSERPATDGRPGGWITPRAATPARRLLRAKSGSAVDTAAAATNRQSVQSLRSRLNRSVTGPDAGARGMPRLD
jgi:hypothetical protein